VPLDGLPVPDAVEGLELLCPLLVLSEHVFGAGGLCDGAPPPASRTDDRSRHKLSDLTEIKTCIACDDRREELF